MTTPAPLCVVDAPGLIAKIQKIKSLIYSGQLRLLVPKAVFDEVEELALQSSNALQERAKFMKRQSQPINRIVPPEFNANPMMSHEFLQRAKDGNLLLQNKVLFEMEPILAQDATRSRALPVPGSPSAARIESAWSLPTAGVNGSDSVSHLHQSSKMLSADFPPKYRGVMKCTLGHRGSDHFGGQTLAEPPLLLTNDSELLELARTIPLPAESLDLWLGSRKSDDGIKNELDEVVYDFTVDETAKDEIMNETHKKILQNGDVQPAETPAFRGLEDLMRGSTILESTHTRNPSLPGTAIRREPVTNNRKSIQQITDKLTLARQLPGASMPVSIPEIVAPGPEPHPLEVGGSIQPLEQINGHLVTQIMTDDDEDEEIVFNPRARRVSSSNQEVMRTPPLAQAEPSKPVQDKPVALNSSPRKFNAQSPVFIPGTLYQSTVDVSNNTAASQSPIPSFQMSPTLLQSALAQGQRTPQSINSSIAGSPLLGPSLISATGNSRLAPLNAPKQPRGTLASRSASSDRILKGSELLDRQREVLKKQKSVPPTSAPRVIKLEPTDSPTVIDPDAFDRSYVVQQPKNTNEGSKSRTHSRQTSNTRPRSSHTNNSDSSSKAASRKRAVTPIVADVPFVLKTGSPRGAVDPDRKLWIP